MTTKEKTVWAAGFFDGEGSVQITRCKAASSSNGYYYALRISASQIDPTPLYILQELFGGRVVSVLPRNKRCRKSFHWLASAGPGITALCAMLPYLVVKNAEARLAIEFQSRRLTRRGSFKRVTKEELRNDKDDFDVMKATRALRNF